MPTDEPTEYHLQEYGIAGPIKIVGALTKLLPKSDVPIVFLIDETHEAECIAQNTAIADVLVEQCNVSLIGVESRTGGFKWDDIYHHDYTSDFDCGEDSTPINDWPGFAEHMSRSRVKVVGVECQGLSNELECDLMDNPPPPPIKDRKFNVLRSEHFIRTLFQLRRHYNLTGNLILNVGGNHNSHIASWITNQTIDTKAGQGAAYVRLRAPAYKE